VKIVTGQKLDAERLLTSHEVGDLLQVNPSSVKKWVNEGRITAFRTPGGHRRIRVADLLEFLDRHAMPIPRSLADATRRRLLIVDDDEVHLRALERRLRQHRARLELELTSNGIDALVLVGSFKPHLIVLDVFMPELDGIEVCRRLKLRNDTRHIGVVVHSAHLTADVERNALAAGALCCLAKPIDIKVLLEHLGASQQQHSGG
jgi:excisionase family DNA binding protein